MPCWWRRGHPNWLRFRRRGHERGRACQVCELDKALTRCFFVFSIASALVYSFFFLDVLLHFSFHPLLKPVCCLACALKPTDLECRLNCCVTDIEQGAAACAVTFRAEDQSTQTVRCRWCVRET
jgi:hypothetical protein